VGRWDRGQYERNMRRRSASVNARWTRIDERNVVLYVEVAAPVADL
jgi:hypothetical protein